MIYKVLSSVVLILLLQESKQNNVNKNEVNDKIAFTIECYQKTFNYGDNPKFILSIENKGDTSITIPNEYVITPVISTVADIVYEVYYCADGDTINASKNLLSIQVDKDYLFPDKYRLDPGSNFLISSEIPKYVCQKKGTYKVRFTLRKNIIKSGLDKDLQTSWVFFKIL